MGILVDILFVIGFMCLFGPFIYRWWTGRDLWTQGSRDRGGLLYRNGGV